VIDVISAERCLGHLRADLIILRGKSLNPEMFVKVADFILNGPGVVKWASGQLTSVDPLNPNRSGLHYWLKPIFLK
jgi:hypothetical protein